MIELVTKYKKDWSMFTLASLLDKSNFRLHLFVHKEDWNRQEIDWIMANFQNVKIYEAFWREENIARMTFYLKQHWKTRGGLAKRMIVWDGPRVFNQPLHTGDIPPEEFFKSSLSFLSRDLAFDTHPSFGGHYDILKIKRKTHQGIPFVDTSIVILNYDKLAEFHDRDLFFTRQLLPPAVEGTAYIDTKLIAANNLAFFEALTFYKHSWSPLYVNGKLDILIERDAISPKEILDYNIMLRKSWSLNVEHKYLARDYYDVSTGIQLGIPWDCYSRLIDSIPLNFRNARINEVLLQKATKQKQMAGKLLERGFYLGKV